MKGLAFDIKGSIAHFRRPDTTATQMTYPFITPTAVRGLVGGNSWDRRFCNAG